MSFLDVSRASQHVGRGRAFDAHEHAMSGGGGNFFLMSVVATVSFKRKRFFTDFGWKTVYEHNGVLHCTMSRNSKPTYIGDVSISL